MAQSEQIVILKRFAPIFFLLKKILFQTQNYLFTNRKYIAFLDRSAFCFSMKKLFCTRNFVVTSTGYAGVSASACRFQGSHPYDPAKVSPRLEMKVLGKIFSLQKFTFGYETML